MKEKTVFNVHIADTGDFNTSEDYLITANNAITASQRGLKIARKEGIWVGTPYVQSLKCQGSVYIFN